MKRLCLALFCCTILLFSFVDAVTETEPENDSLSPIEMNGKWGYINSNGNIVIQPQWTSAGEFSKYAARVSAAEGAQGAWPHYDGLIDRNGGYILFPDYYICETKYSFYVSKKTESESLWGYFDKDSGYYLAPQYEDICDAYPYYMKPTKDDWIAVKQNGKWGFIQRETGEGMLPFIYDEIGATFCNDHAMVFIYENQAENEETVPWIWPAFLIDRDGRPEKFEDNARPCDGISKHGNVIIGKSVELLQNGALSSYVLYGIANVHGETLIEMQYYGLSWVNDHMAVFCTTPWTNWGLMDEYGNILIEPTYEYEEDVPIIEETIVQ